MIRQLEFQLEFQLVELKQTWYTNYFRRFNADLDPISRISRVWKRGQVLFCVGMLRNSVFSFF